MYSRVIDFIRALYGKFEGVIPLHEPCFGGNEKRYVVDAIDSTFVSSVGEYVNRFETMIADITGARYAVATVNGTAGIHVALLLAGVQEGDEVITQPLTFIATANAIRHAGAFPVFVDVDKDTLGLSPKALQEFLEQNAQKHRSGSTVNRTTGRRIAACVPMHTFGLPARIKEIAEVCARYSIPIVEDAAESLGSTYRGRHTGTFGRLGVFSFNGNKIVTSGGGGCIVTDDRELAVRAKHITTTAKIPHRWEYSHDEIGFNYRLTNLCAALACAQLEQLSYFIVNKRKIAADYASFFSGNEKFRNIKELPEAKSNYWLNAVCLEDREQRDAFLAATNDVGVMTRPIWALIHRMPMYAGTQKGNLQNAEWLEARVVNLPSSVIRNASSGY